MNKLHVCTHASAATHFTYSYHTVAPSTSVMWHRSKKEKCTDMKPSESYSLRAVSVKWSSCRAMKNREETVIWLLPFKCQLSSSLRTGAEGGPFSVASVCEWLLVSFDLISILTWGHFLIFGTDLHKGTHAFWSITFKLLFVSGVHEISVRSKMYSVYTGSCMKICFIYPWLGMGVMGKKSYCDMISQYRYILRYKSNHCFSWSFYS